MRGLVGNPDGTEIVHGKLEAAADQPEALGIELAEDLLSRGADRILRDFYQQDL